MLINKNKSNINKQKSNEKRTTNINKQKSNEKRTTNINKQKSNPWLINKQKSSEKRTTNIDNKKAADKKHPTNLLRSSAQVGTPKQKVADKKHTTKPLRHNTQVRSNNIQNLAKKTSANKNNDTKIKELQIKFDNQIKNINKKFSLFTQTQSKANQALREKDPNMAKLKIELIAKEKQLREKQQRIENIEKDKNMAISMLEKIQNLPLATPLAPSVAKNIPRKQPLTDLQKKQKNDKTRLTFLAIKTRKYLLSKWIRSEILTNFKVDTIESEPGFLTFKAYKESGNWHNKYKLLWSKLLKPELHVNETEILRYTNASCFNYRNDYIKGLTELQNVFETYNREKNRLNNLSLENLGIVKDSLVDTENNQK